MSLFLAAVSAIVVSKDTVNLIMLVALSSLFQITRSCVLFTSLFFFPNVSLLLLNRDTEIHVGVRSGHSGEHVGHKFQPLPKALGE